MILRSPCPKCREPMLASAAKCLDCSYRLTSSESRWARRIASVKLLTASVVVAATIYIASHR